MNHTPRLYMAPWERQYLHHMYMIMHTGMVRQNRTGIQTKSIFAPDPIRVNLADGFPLLQSKRVRWHIARVELMWMLRGESTTDYLHEHGIKLWDAWADDDGNLGHVYGPQWRNFGPGFDQLENLIANLREDPDSRRHIVSTWNPTVDKALEPCPVMFQCNVAGNQLDMHMYQRSADLFLGVPFDIAEYAALTHILAGFAGLNPGSLTISYGDMHIYMNQMDAVETLMERTSNPQTWIRNWQDIYTVPRLQIMRSPNRYDTLSAWLANAKPEDLAVVDYSPLQHIPAPVAV